MTVFDQINVVGRIVLAGIVVYKLAQYREMANTIERHGLGMIGAGSFLTVPIILAKNENPFEGWAVSLLTIGVIMLLVGRTYRDSKHARQNAAAIRQGREWQAQKGKP